MKSIVLICLFAIWRLHFPEYLHAQIGQKVKTATIHGITGTWRNSSMGFNMDLTLKPDGKGAFDEESITYEYSGNILVVKSGGNKTTYMCMLEGNNLTLSGGDLDAPLTFTKVSAGGNLPAQTNLPTTTQAAASTTGSLIGTWVATNEEISFTDDGKFIYNGVPLAYTLQGSQINVSAPAGSIVFQYALNGNTLSLKSQGVDAVYTRKGTSGNTGAGVSGPPSGIQTDASGGTIDPSLVGKWSYVGAANNPSGSFSTEEYITLNADGTYEYYSESSGSARGSDMYGNQTYSGGMASQSADRGTWRVKGNTIIANSQRHGVKVYQLQKRNHPKNGDPMIILDGTAYVTYYQKAPWR
jgi:hypothetical protein